MKVRLENFGGIVALERPAVLVFADRRLMRRMGHRGGAVWGGDEKVGLLAGPVEVHLSITGVCHNGCLHCYSDSKPLPEARPSFEEMKRRVDLLADMGAFHVALGGGEPFLEEWIFDLAKHIRSKGMIPNVTTSGVPITEVLARRCRVFGQINVSLDGVGERYGVHRGTRGFDSADRALRFLRKHHKKVGINCVVSRLNVDHLPEVLDYAESIGLNEVEFLRYKPAGRAARQDYFEKRLTPEQGREFFPRLFEWAKRYRPKLKADCSFVPFLCFHDPGVETLEHFVVQGCAAGNYLMAVEANGKATGCSFWSQGEGTLDEVAGTWSDPGRFGVFRGWTDRPPAPCDTCDYVSMCRGGCRAVAAFVTGDSRQPDPECPKVLEYVADARSKSNGH